MIITEEMLTHIADLSHIKIQPSEQDALIGGINDIVRYIDILNTLDTEGVTPLSHLGEAGNRLREDEPGPSIPVEEILQNAPEHTDEFFTVPRIIT